MAECARKALAWKEAVRFTVVHAAFSELREVISQVVDPMIEQVARLPDEIARVIEQDNPSGRHTIQLVITPPDQWREQFDAACKRERQLLDME